MTEASLFALKLGFTAYSSQKQYRQSKSKNNSPLQISTSNTNL